MTTDTGDTPILHTRIPEGHNVDGLEYGAHVSKVGWSGYYVRPEGSDRWGIARLTPASNELVGDDAAIVDAIRGELQCTCVPECVDSRCSYGRHDQVPDHKWQHAPDCPAGGEA